MLRIKNKTRDTIEALIRVIIFSLLLKKYKRGSEGQGSTSMEII